MRWAVFFLLASVLFLLTLGTVMLSSAPAGWENNNMQKQVVFCVLGGLVCWITASLDYALYKKYSRWIFAFAMLALLAVLLVGTVRGGARRWFNLGFMLIQPSEMAKLALIIVLAAYAEWNRSRMNTFRHGIFYPALICVPMLVLVIAEPDFGTTVLMAMISAVILFLAGVRWVPIVAACLLGAVIVGGFVYLDPVRRARVEAMFDRDGNSKGAWFQTDQSITAFGSGGMTGLGLGEGRQKRGYVPENQTDFIGSIVGEELGFRGTIITTIAYLVFFICGIYISCRSRDPFGYYVGMGITFLIVLQAAINIGVVTGILPNKGLPLPFVSYGGSSLVMMMACTGVLLSVARHSVVEDAVFAEPLSFDDLTPRETR